MNEDNHFCILASDKLYFISSHTSLSMRKQSMRGAPKHAWGHHFQGI